MAERRKFGESFSQSVDQNGRQQSENRLPLGYLYSFGARIGAILMVILFINFAERMCLN